MLYVPTLNITSPRLKKFKKSCYSPTTVNNNSDVVDFADLATTPVDKCNTHLHIILYLMEHIFYLLKRRNHNIMTYMQLYKLQRDNHSLRQR